MATLQLPWSWGWIWTSGLRPWRPGLLLWWGFLELAATFFSAYFLQNSREAEWNHMLVRRREELKSKGPESVLHKRGPDVKGSPFHSESGLRPDRESSHDLLVALLWATWHKLQRGEFCLHSTKWQKVTCWHRGEGKTINNTHQSLALKETLSQTKRSLARLFFSVSLNLGL